VPAELFSNKNVLNNINSAKIGTINKVFMENPYDDKDKRIFCDITVLPSGEFKNVPIYGGGIDFDTEFTHGVFALPRKNQLILILFINSNFENPVACIPLPYNFNASDEHKNLFNEPIEDVEDLGVYHFSGSRLILRKNGTIDIQKRIEESTDTFVNHTLNIEFKYEDEKRKKIISDVDNEFVVEIVAKEDVKFTDNKNQSLNFHSKDNEEFIELLDKAEQTIKMNSESGSEGITITDKNDNVIETSSTGISLEDQNGSKIAIDNNLIDISNSISDLKSEIDNLWSAIISINTNLQSFVSTNCVVGSPVTPNPATIALFVADNVQNNIKKGLVGSLLK
jgi:prefoldin subunit 5